MSFKKGCVAAQSEHPVKLSDSGKYALINNETRNTYEIIHFDGCEIIGSLAADFVIHHPAVGDCIVELKGSDVNHALDQVTETAKYLAHRALRRGKLAGLVISTKYPRIDTKVQRCKAMFKSKWNAKLTVQPNLKPINFQSLFFI